MTSKAAELPLYGIASNERGPRTVDEFDTRDRCFHQMSESESDSDETGSLQDSSQDDSGGDGDSNDDESEYEYEYIDEGDERDVGEEKQKEGEEAQNRALGTKRKAPLDAQWLLSKTASDSARQKCLSISLSSATNLRGYNCQGQKDCFVCNRENHSPVASCALASEWIKGNINESISSSGITTWPSEYVIPSISFRTHECSMRWNLPQEQVSVHLQRQGWNAVEAHHAIIINNNDNNNQNLTEQAVRELQRDRIDAHREYLASTVRESAPPVQENRALHQIEARDESLANTVRESTAPAQKNRALGFCEKICRNFRCCVCPVATKDASEDGTKDGAEEDTECGTENTKKDASEDCSKDDRQDDIECGIEYGTENTKEIVLKRACGICMEDFDPDELLSLGCGHSFCSDCWQQYLETSFAGNFGGNRALHVTCPEALCTELVGESHIRKVAPDLIPRFEQHCLNAFVQTNNDVMRWCPGPNCNRIAIKTDMFFAGEGGCQGQTAVCGGKGGCQTRFCFLCGREPHTGPCPLPIAALPVEAQQQQQRQQLGSTNNEKMIQRCPRCKSPIEKNGGCNHMTCKCGCHFCWLCNADITEVGYRHYCGREPSRQRRPHVERRRPDRFRLANLDYICDALEWKEAQEKSNPMKGADESNPGIKQDAIGVLTTRKPTTRAMFQDVLRMKEQMRSVSHYYNRFVAHNQGQEFAMNQCRCVSDRADEFNKISGIKSATDRDFLAEANALLVSSRRVLKYSYCYAYQEKEKAVAAANSAAAAAETKLDEDAGNSIDYGSIDHSNRLSIFQMRQEQLERSTEQLSEVSERAFNLDTRHRVLDLMEVVGRAMKAVVNFDAENQSIANIDTLTIEPLAHKVTNR